MMPICLRPKFPFLIILKSSLGAEEDIIFILSEQEVVAGGDWSGGINGWAG